MKSANGRGDLDTHGMPNSCDEQAKAQEKVVTNLFQRYASRLSAPSEIAIIFV
jgi:hypothetical protein